MQIVVSGLINLKLFKTFKLSRDADDQDTSIDFNNGKKLNDYNFYSFAFLLYFQRGSTRVAIAMAMAMAMAMANDG
jgi:hypothetical protein